MVSGAAIVALVCSSPSPTMPAESASAWAEALLPRPWLWASIVTAPVTAIDACEASEAAVAAEASTVAVTTEPVPLAKPIDVTFADAVARFSAVAALTLRLDEFATDPS